VEGLLNDQAAGKTEQLSYSPEKTTADVVNDTDINGLAASVSQVLTGKGFTAGAVGNNEGGHVANSQVQAAKADDLGAQAISKELGNLPVVEDATLPPGTVRVVLSADYTGPGSGLDGPTGLSGDSAVIEQSSGGSADSAEPPPPPSPILTAGSDDPACVN
jgi:hypothetical protein